MVILPAVLSNAKSPITIAWLGGLLRDCIVHSVKMAWQDGGYYDSSGSSSQRLSIYLGYNYINALQGYQPFILTRLARSP